MNKSEIIDGEMTAKQKKILKFMDVLIVITACVCVGLLLYKIVFNKTSKEDKFLTDYDNLMTECTINSCSVTEFDEKLDKLKTKSGLTEEKIEELLKNK